MAMTSFADEEQKDAQTPEMTPAEARQYAADIAAIQNSPSSSSYPPTESNTAAATVQEQSPPSPSYSFDTMSTNVPYIIGLPPDDFIDKTNREMYNAMPIMEIYPSNPKFKEGLSLFTLEDAFGEYSDILEQHGFIAEKPIRIAFSADSFPTDTFTNEYDESFLNKLGDVVSSGAAELIQMTGNKSATDALKSGASKVKEMGGMGDFIGGAMQSGLDQMRKFSDAMSAGGGLGAKLAGAGGLIDRMLAGARVDFPKVWKSSNYTSTYSFNIKLYNPNPASDDSTEEFIIGPLATLLLLGLPITDDGETFRWPFLHRIICPGLFVMDPAFISNITVVKGGDQQQIAYNQRLAMVDVRIDIGCLYDSILAGNDYSSTDRPTLEGYLNNLRDKKELLRIYDNRPEISFFDLFSAPLTFTAGIEVGGISLEVSGRADLDSVAVDAALSIDQPLIII